MKKKILIILSVLLVVMLAGCSTKKNDEKENSDTGETIQSEEVVNDEKEETKGEDIAALSVANDQFAFDELVGQIGVTETELSEFLGATETAAVYNAKIFGENVTISVNAQENMVQTMELVFTDVNADSVVIAISEQLGQDGQENDGILQWTFGENVVSLSQDGSGCIVNIQ